MLALTLCRERFLCVSTFFGQTCFHIMFQFSSLPLQSLRVPTLDVMERVRAKTSTPVLVCEFTR
jgi:hypothetical protein